MGITKVTYKLMLSHRGISITEISFGDKTKRGSELQEDYKAVTNSFEGEFNSVYCDCHRINIKVAGDGPVGGKTNMSATLCENKKLRDQPIEHGENNGSYNYSKEVQVV